MRQSRKKQKRLKLIDSCIMSHWNHRIVRHKNDMKEPWYSEEPYWFGVHEVYYNDNDPYQNVFKQL